MEDYSIFSLLDEELVEGKPAGEIEDNDCKITEQTAFKHILEKAKTFLVWTTSNNVHFPSSEPLILRRKHPHEKHLQLYDKLDDLEETEGVMSPQATLGNQSSRPTEAKSNEHAFNSYRTPKSHTTAESRLPSQCKDCTSRTLTEETIFDRIRKKSKNFPMFNFNATKTRYFRQMNSQNEHEFGIAASEISKETNFSVVLRESTIIPDLQNEVLDRDASGTKAGIKWNADIISGSSLGNNGKFDVYPKVSVTNAEPLSIKMLSFDISMMKSNMQFEEPGSSMEVKKQNVLQVHRKCIAARWHQQANPE